MKSIFKFLMLVMPIAMAVGVSGCKDDKDNPDSASGIDSDQQLVGYWKGYDYDDESWWGFCFKDNGIVVSYEPNEDYEGGRKIISESYYYYDDSEKILLNYFPDNSGSGIFEYVVYKVRNQSGSGMRLDVIGDDEDDVISFTYPVNKEKCEKLINYYASQGAYAYSHIDMTKMSESAFESWWDSFEGAVEIWRL